LPRWGAWPVRKVDEGTTQIFDSDNAVLLGSWDTQSENLVGHLAAAQIRSGIGGTVVANFEASGLTSLDPHHPVPYTDSTGTV
jgi:hypothetical protein